MQRGRWCVVVVALAGCAARVDDGQDPEVLEKEDLAPNQTREGEACDQYLATNVCGAKGEGVQYCDYLLESAGEITQWGVCVVNPECSPGEERECGEGEWGVCEMDGVGVPYWGDCEEVSSEESTPLVIQFEGERLGFDAVATASFDLGAECLASDWPQANTPWLAIDLDGSGSIDGGHELFGSATRLPDGTRAHHGFEALAALDHDHDGAITKADPAFASLVLWADHDGDRRSTHWEHTSLSAAGITELPIAYETRTECDARGNCARERAPMFAASASGTRMGELVDVHLACQ